MIQPQLLRANDCIAILSPAGHIEPKLVYGLANEISNWRFKHKIMSHCLDTFGRFAGNKEERLSDLIEAIKDPNIKAIWCSRGGYGVMQILGPQLDLLKEHPKWIIGYSDITALHRVAQSLNIESIHAPMAKHFSEEGTSDNAMQALYTILTKGSIKYQRKGHHLNRQGETQGVLEGGNLAVLAGLRGTHYDLHATDTILFIEDIGERPYQIERMMINLRLSGKLEKIKGLLVGQFTGYEEDQSMGKELYEVIEQCVHDYQFPVVYDFPVGHVRDNLPLICGRKTTLKVTQNEWQLTM